MERKIELLAEWGCDVKGALRRISGDKAFYIECLGDISNDENFEKLINGLKTHNLKMSFEAAHTLKGLFVNFGLTEMYNLSLEIAEPLKNGEDKGLLEKAEQLADLREKLVKILADGK